MLSIISLILLVLVQIILWNNSKKYAQSYSRFEQILKKKGITSYRVATDLNFSPMLLSDWKRDKSKPKLDTMIKIASYLDEPVESFVD